MMNQTTINGKSWTLVRRIAAASASGMVLATGCSADQVSAVLSGIEVVTRELGNGGSSRGSDVDLGDWLSSQVSDF
ncbi:MAG: hypothetical protein ACPGXK_00510 [Phycisphaerae bacterium]